MDSHLLNLDGVVGLVEGVVVQDSDELWDTIPREESATSFCKLHKILIYLRDQLCISAKSRVWSPFISRQYWPGCVFFKSLFSLQEEFWDDDMMMLVLAEISDIFIPCRHYFDCPPQILTYPISFEY